MKSIMYSMGLLLLFLTASTANAQDQKLYSFSLKQNGQHITSSQGSLTMTDAQTGANQFAQLFILKRLSGGNVLILSAADTDLFLKRDGNNVILASYTVSDNDFEWDLRYSGYPYLCIATPGANSILSWQAGSGFTMVNSPAALGSNNDTSGDHYRFSLANVANTF